MVKRELRDAKRVYVNGTLQNGLESGNNKPFWKYVKSPKQETFGISVLKSNGNVITDELVFINHVSINHYSYGKQTFWSGDVLPFYGVNNK